VQSQKALLHLTSGYVCANTFINTGNFWTFIFKFPEIFDKNQATISELTTLGDNIVSIHRRR